MFYAVNNKINQRLVNRRQCVQTLLAMSASLALTPDQLQAQPADKTRIVLWLDDASSLVHLPVLLALHLGYFKAEGLQVDVTEFSAAQAAGNNIAPGVLQIWSASLLMCLQAYRWQESALSIVQTGRTPELALCASKKTFTGSKNLKELEGKKVGLLDAGSFAQNCIDYASLLSGGNPKNINYVTLANASAAINQLHSGAIDYLCASDPLVTLLEKKGDIEMISNWRSLKQTQRVFGGLMPGNSVLVPASLARKSPGVCQAVVNAVVRANKWLRTAGPSDLLGSMLDSAYLTDRAIYLNAVDNMRESYAIDGMLSNDAVALAARLANALEPERAGERQKSGVFYTNEFVLQAKKRFKI